MDPLVPLPPRRRVPARSATPARLVTLTTLVTCAALAALVGCSTARSIADGSLFNAARVAVGQTEADARRAYGEPTGRYALDGGASRLEFAQGPMGKVTWMVDVDAGGRIVAVEQVLVPAKFASVVRNGMPADEVLRTFGRPADRQREYGNRTTWYWRYDNPDCLWMAVTMSPLDRVVGGAATINDPRCDPQH